jgi:wyosine [tRNA(Phe)-imidazoG37] synthetase (radical SAM superfamily)
MAEKYKYIYGPVPSWRLGRSLGVDPISTPEKTCPFNCTYCQLGESVKYETERRVFVPTAEVIAEISSLPEDVTIDYITFSGRGEPTLAKNLGELTNEIRKIRSEPIAILTDSSLVDRVDVRDDLLELDLVMAKLDTPNEDLFQQINRPAPGITLAIVLAGLEKFREEFKGRFALQIMLVEANRDSAAEIAAIARSLSPDEVQLNTPLRPSAVQPLSSQEMTEAAGAFEGMNVVSVYDAEHKEVRPISTKDALYRRGKRL